MAMVVTHLPIKTHFPSLRTHSTLRISTSQHRFIIHISMETQDRRTIRNKRIHKVIGLSKIEAQTILIIHRIIFNLINIQILGIHDLLTTLNKVKPCQIHPKSILSLTQIHILLNSITLSHNLNNTNSSHIRITSTNQGNKSGQNLIIKITNKELISINNSSRCKWGHKENLLRNRSRRERGNSWGKRSSSIHLAEIPLLKAIYSQKRIMKHWYLPQISMLNSWYLISKIK